MKKIVLLTIAVAGIFSAKAQMVFSLEEAVDYALKHNKQLKANRYEIEKSENAYKEVRAGWMPQVDAKVDYMTYFGYEAELAFGGESASFSQEDYANALTAANIAAGKTSGTGIFDPSQYAGSKAYDASLQAAMAPTKIDMSGTSTANIQLAQVLFNGQLLSGIRAAKIGKEMATKNVELSELDVRANVADAYYSSLILKQTLETIDRSLKEMQDLFNKTEVMVKAGVMERTELDQLKVQLNTLRNTKLSMNRNLQITYNLLRFHLGLNVNEPIKLTDKLGVIMGAMEKERSLAQGLDISNNINYQLMKKQVELSEEMVNMEKMAYVPTLTAFYAYNAKLLTSGFDMNPNHVAGATLSIPIFSSGKRKHKVAQQKAELMQAQANQGVLEDNLRLQEAQLRFDYISKYEEYKNEKENVEVARRVFENYERKFAQGVASGLDLTQANNNYLQAESSYLSATLSLLQARVAFFKLMNSL